LVPLLNVTNLTVCLSISPSPLFPSQSYSRSALSRKRVGLFVQFKMLRTASRATSSTYVLCYVFNSKLVVMLCHLAKSMGIN